CAVIALAAYHRRLVVLDHDLLMHLATGVPARVNPVPGFVPVVRPAAPSCRAIAVAPDRRTTARITGCRIGEHRGGWALHCAVIALAAYHRRRVVLDHDGLTHCAAGVPAGVYRVPGLGPGV